MRESEGRDMRKKKRLYLLPVILLSILTITGCGGEGESWAYDHDPTVEILNLGGNGKAVFKGEKFSRYTKDDDTITLSGKDGELTIRYEMDKDNMILYEESTYNREEGDASEGIVGKWTQDNGWLYVFDESGEFNEDGYFTGHYRVNEADSSIKLMYSDPIPDATLYYSLDGDKLTIAYPWTLVRTQDSN
jgi:hypothetical protein